jgi:hypothetical protein
MTRRRIVMMGVVAAALLMLVLPVTASAWQYTFKDFFFNPKPGTFSSGNSRVERCTESIVGDWNFRSGFETRVKTSEGSQGVEMVLTAVMPITEKLRPLRDINIRVTTKLPKDPTLAKLMEKFYERLAESQERFWERVTVKWLVDERKLLINHGFMKLNGNVIVEPGQTKTPFKPQPGCADADE